MLWLKIVGILYLYRLTHSAIKVYLAEPRYKKLLNRKDYKGMQRVWFGVMALWFMFVAVFAFWILWLTGNPI